MKMQSFANQQFVDAILKLLEVDGLPIKASYRISKIHKAIVAESEKFDEMRRSIVKKYAKTKEDGSLDIDEAGNVAVPNENIDAFNADMKDLFDIEFEVGTISVAELGDAKITPKMFGILSDILVD